MKAIPKKNVYALIMAGGVGTRFWPVSTEEFPKQFHDMLGTGSSLLQHTYQRMLKLVPASHILILTNARYTSLVQEQLPEVLPEHIIGEPHMRNTAPCVLLSALKVKTKDPDAVMVVAPSDSWIENQDAFVADVTLAITQASQNNRLITLGIQPTFANTGYGYIAADLKDETAFAKAKSYPVQRFTEKPDQVTASHFIAQGNYLWNAGMFVWSVASILKAYEAHLPKMYSLFNSGSSQFNTPTEEQFINTIYAKAESISIDYGIMEKSSNVFVVPATFDWDDLGTWGALYEKLPKDHSDMAIVNANVLNRDSQGCMVYAATNKHIVIDALKDYIVVDKEDTLIIVPRHKQQEIKQIRAAVLAKSK